MLMGLEFSHLFFFCDNNEIYCKILELQELRQDTTIMGKTHWKEELHQEKEKQRKHI